MDNAVDDLIETFGQASLGDEGQGPEQLLCEPPSSSKASKSLDDIPAYLFRVVFPLSAGKTDDIWARSESACQRTVSSTKDIFSFQHINDRQTKASELNVHLRWRGGSTPAEDNFVSWTSSLLFAIQYIYYRRHHDIPRPYINDVKLYIIDTTLFQRGTFIRDLDLIEEFREFDSGNSPGQYWNLRSLYSLRTGNSYYFGEYLSQGSLKIENKFTVIPASILFDDRRLCRVQPAFKNLYVPPPRNDPKWAKAVIDLRQEIWPSKLLVLSSVDILDRLAAIKEVLDSMSERDLKHRWRFPLGIYLAALIGPMPATESHTGNESIFFEHFRSATWAGKSSLGYSDLQKSPMTQYVLIICLHRPKAI